MLSWKGPACVSPHEIDTGGVAERLKAPVLKSSDRRRWFRALPCQVLHGADFLKGQVSRESLVGPWVPLESGSPGPINGPIGQLVQHQPASTRQRSSPGPHRTDPRRPSTTPRIVPGPRRTAGPWAICLGSGPTAAGDRARALRAGGRAPAVRGAAEAHRVCRTGILTDVAPTMLDLLDGSRSHPR
jgi:hypothetical protein